MPLNIVIGKDGVIKYIHSGKITAEEELSDNYQRTMNRR